MTLCWSLPICTWSLRAAGVSENPDKLRWQNRRRMAWGALVGGLVFPLAVVAESGVADIAMAFYLFVGSVVGAYIGFSTADDKWRQ